MTPSENMKHAINELGFKPSETLKKKLVGESSEGILIAASFMDAVRWADATFDINSSKSNIWRAIYGQRKTSHGFKWKYLDDYTNE